MAPALAATVPDGFSVSISLAGDALEVVYTLPAPRTSLSLRMSEGPAPAANVQVKEAGLIFTAGRISSHQPFTRATLRVTPDGRETDSIYPLAVRLNETAFVVYAPYLIPMADRARVSIIETGRAAPLSEREADGYVVVGAAPVQRRGFLSLSGAGVPQALEQDVVRRTTQLLAFYRAKLKTRPPTKPLVILAQYDLLPGMRRSLLRGDVSANGVVFLRSYVGDTASGGAPTSAQHARFLAHELFHLWTRGGDRAGENAWLAEGGAEYAGWLASSFLWPTEHRLEQSVSGALRTCMMYLGPQAISSLDEQQARSVRYPCGAVIQWVVDTAARSRAANRDGFAIWRRLLARREHNGIYTLSDFRAAIAELAPTATAPVEALISGSGIERWEALAQGMNASGAQVRIDPPTSFSLRLAAAKALVLSACGEVHGVGENEGLLFVQAPESCAVFGDAPVVEEANGITVMSDAAAFYDAVRARCAERGLIEVVLNGERGPRTRQIACNVAVERPPPQLEVIRALP